MKNKNIFAHLAVLSANLIYGINYTFAKDVMPSYIKPFGFIFLRALGALSLFWFVSLFFKTEHRPSDYLQEVLSLVFAQLFCFSRVSF